MLRRLWLWVYDYAKRTYQKRVVGIDVYEGIDYSMYEPHMKDFFYLGLKKRDVVRLLNVFLEVDMDRSGLVDDLEFLTFIAGWEKRAKFPTSKAPISVDFHSFWLTFGRAIMSRTGLEAWMFFSGTRARGTLALKRR